MGEEAESGEGGGEGEGEKGESGTRREEGGGGERGSTDPLPSPPGFGTWLETYWATINCRMSYVCLQFFNCETSVVARTATSAVLLKGIFGGAPGTITRRVSSQSFVSVSVRNLV